MVSVLDLPDELLLQVFSYLSVSDVSLSVARVCVHWSALACDWLLWNQLELTIDKSMELGYVLALLPHLPQLRFINLQWRTDSADIVDTLCAHCPLLTGIRLICCGFVDRGLVQQLFDTYEKLKVFSLGKSWAVPSRCLDDVILLTNLTTLNLSHSLLTPEQFNAISLNCTKIDAIDIDYVRGISEQNLTQFMLLRRSTLRSLSMFGELLTDNIFRELELCCRLKLLHVSTCRNFTDKCFTSLIKLKCLKSLTLRKAVLLSSQAVTEFYYQSKTINNLSHLYISAKRTIRSDDYLVFSKINFDIENNVINHYCTYIVNKDGIKLYKIQ